MLGEESDVVSEVISAAELELEEATRIIHVDGRWVSQDIEQTEHTIVDVGMPAATDFIKYYQWCKGQSTNYCQFLNVFFKVLEISFLRSIVYF